MDYNLTITDDFSAVRLAILTVLCHFRFLPGSRTLSADLAVAIWACLLAQARQTANIHLRVLLPKPTYTSALVCRSGKGQGLSPHLRLVDINKVLRADEGDRTLPGATHHPQLVWPYSRG